MLIKHNIFLQLFQRLCICLFVLFCLFIYLLVVTRSIFAVCVCVCLLVDISQWEIFPTWLCMTIIVFEFLKELLTSMNENIVWKQCDCHLESLLNRFTLHFPIYSFFLIICLSHSHVCLFLSLSLSSLFALNLYTRYMTIRLNKIVDKYKINRTEMWHNKWCHCIVHFFIYQLIL